MNPATLTKSYNAKILLFGEHLINLGSDALSIPYDKFNGKLVSTKNSGQRLKPFIDFLKSNKFDFLNQTKFDQGQNFEFVSNIPEGYGCGSSGAIVAACYSDFKAVNSQEDKNALKSYFSKMESFFHGKSSGTDPLISYLNTPIRFQSNGIIESISGFKPILENYSLIIVDSGSARNGKEYIDWFMTKSSDKDFAQLLNKVLVPATQDCINHLLTESTSSFISAFKSLSNFQYQHMDKMIPDNMKMLWLAGLKSSKLYLKICGAGGGGFFIGLIENGTELTELERFSYHSLG